MDRALMNRGCQRSIPGRLSRGIWAGELEFGEAYLRTESSGSGIDEAFPRAPNVRCPHGSLPAVQFERGTKEFLARTDWSVICE